MLCMWWCSDTSYYIAIMGYMISGGVHHMDASAGTYIHAAKPWISLCMHITAMMLSMDMDV